MRLFTFNWKRYTLFILLIVLSENNHSNGSKVKNDQDIDSFLDALSKDIDNQKTSRSDEAKSSLTESSPSVIAKKNSKTFNVETSTVAKTETSTVSPETTQHSSQWTMFFILCILGISILLIHVLIETNFHYLPESVAVVFLGAMIGLIFKLLSQWKITDWSKEETFTPEMFFLILLPPIIFESGYNLHKGNFFQNFGSILVFAIFGTAISAFIMGSGIWLLGQTGLVYSLNAKESFAFGSLVSAVDPVATLAIFNALDIDPVLYMLVFGESILNDAVAIVLTNTIMELSVASTSVNFMHVIGYITGKFCLMFFASAMIGIVFGLASALLFKYVDLRKTPSLETAFMFIFMYSPYAFAEAIKLSGIMAILFAGLIMSHYTHLNLSSVTRITIQQIFRTLAFIAETCVFAYLGMAIFSFKHIFKPSLVITSIVMCLVSRACNIFPLSIALNYFREHKITKKMQFIMWFSGLRGAIAFALSLNLQINEEVRHVIVTSTLILVLFTTLILGGSTLPLMKFLNADKSNRRRKQQFIFVSKTKEMGETVDALMNDESQNNEQDMDENDLSTVNIHIVRSGVRLRGFARLDEKFLKPFFIRKFTDEELRDGQLHMSKLTKQWFDEANKNNKETDLDDQVKSKVTFKKSSNTQNGDIKLTLENKTYHKLDSKNNVSSVLLESTDEDDDEDDDVIIDKTKFIKRNPPN